MSQLAMVIDFECVNVTVSFSITINLQAINSYGVNVTVSFSITINLQRDEEIQ